MRLVVFEYKACDLEYFLDKMQPYEISIILEQLQYTQKISWEQTRMISYIQAATQSTKKLKMTDIMKFPWDEEEKEKENDKTTVTQEDKQRLIEKMNKIMEEKNNK